MNMKTALEIGEFLIGHKRESAALSVADSYLSERHWEDKSNHQCIDANCRDCEASHEARRKEFIARLTTPRER